MARVIPILLFLASTIVPIPPAYPGEVHLIVPVAVKPYVFSETESGIELDIAKEAFHFKGHTTRFSFYPYARLLNSFEAADAVMLVTESSGLKNAWFSQPYITYTNVAVTLKKSQIKIQQIRDLENRSIIAFQKATYYLGDPFVQAVENNPAYREMPRQDNQVAMLFAGRVEVIILDVNIFRYYRQNTHLVTTDLPVRIHRIFPENHFKIAFHNPKIRDDFNEGLKHLRQTGRYQKIIDRYIHPYDENRPSSGRP